MIVRLYLIPGLGAKRLTSRPVPMVQGFLNERLAKGDSVRKVQVMRTVLSAALTLAMREELLFRNVARLVELPEWQRGTLWLGRPTKLGGSSPFQADPRDPAFVMLILDGLRRGEALGLRWEDIHFDGGTIESVGNCNASEVNCCLPRSRPMWKRDLPLLDLARQALKLQAARAGRLPGRHGSRMAGAGLAIHDQDGTPGLESRNFVRSFRRICDDNRVRLIKVHHLRHTVGSFLEDLRVPPRDAKPSSATPGSAPRWRSIPTLTGQPAATLSPGYTGRSTRAKADAATENSYRCGRERDVQLATLGRDLAAPGGIRTPGPLLRRQLLYPAELQAPTERIAEDPGEGPGHIAWIAAMIVTSRASGYPFGGHVRRGTTGFVIARSQRMSGPRQNEATGPGLTGPGHCAAPGGREGPRPCASCTSIQMPERQARGTSPATPASPPGAGQARPVASF